MHVPLRSSPQRDLRLDFFRGVALLCIFIDHMPGNRLTEYTLRNLGFSDASEAFVFISAVAAGLVYARRARRDGWTAAAARLWRRALQLYGAHLALLVAATAFVNWLSRALRDRQFVQGMNVVPLLDRPWEWLPDVLLLKFQPTFMDILPLYVVLLALTPLMLWAIERSVGWTLVVSFALYAVIRIRPDLLMEGATSPWQFNPVAWQLLFVVGVAVGTGMSGRGLRVPRSTWVLAAAIAYAAAAFFIGMRAWEWDGSTVVLPSDLHALVFPVMERTHLSLWRLAHVLSLAYIISYALTPDAAFLRSRLARPLVLCGQHSLPLFCAGVLLSIGGWALLVKYGSALPMQVAVNVGGCALHVVLAWLLGRSRPAVRVRAAA